MDAVIDTYVTGAVVAASLAPEAVQGFDPVLRRLLAGQIEFVKMANGRWRPQGCQLGLARCFDFSELRAPVARH
jgi:hypothetical protein